MFGNHGLGGLLKEGAHEKSPKCLGGNLGDFGGFCKGLSLKIVCALWLALSVVLTMRFMSAGHLLFFASPKNKNLHSLSARTDFAFIEHAYCVGKTS